MGLKEVDMDLPGQDILEAISKLSPTTGKSELFQTCSDFLEIRESIWLLIKISLTLDTGIMAVSSARGLGLMRKEDAFKIYKILHPLIIFPCFILNENKRNMGEIEYKT